MKGIWCSPPQEYKQYLFIVNNFHRVDCYPENCITFAANFLYINMNYLLTIGFLVVSNVFMTLAWYGHLKMAENAWFSKLPLFGVILISWLIAFFEYCFQVPANRIGFEGNGGNFSLLQLKVMQEVITLVIFVLFSSIAFQTQLKLNHLIGFFLLVLAVYFIFKN